MQNCRININLDDYIVGQPTLSVPLDIGLTPFYGTPEEVLLFFAEEGSSDWIEYFERIVNLLFNGSRAFDRLLNYNSITIADPSLRQAMAEKYAMCYATYWAGIKIFQNRLRSVSKSKNLGDFSISYRGDKDETAVNAIIKDAKSCLDEIGVYVSGLADAEIGKASGFRFRQTGAKVSPYSTRRWDYMVPEFGIAYAGNKRVLQDGSTYKTGAYYQYWMIGKLGYENWGYDGYYTW